jgi:large subunit ribosomal protein L35
MAGYKIKTKSSAKKRFKITANGKIKRSKAKMNHILTKQRKSNKRKLAKRGTIAPADMAAVKRMLPYG